MAALQAFGPANEIAPAPSLIGSLQAGAALGTQLRGQDIAANEAKDRLSLAYAQLQSQEERAAEQAQAKLTLAQATMAARQQQQDLMAGYREQALKQQQEHSQNLAAQAAANLDYKQQSGAQMMDLRERRLADLQDYRQGLEAQREKANAMREKDQAFREAVATAPRLGEVDKAELGSDISELKGLQKKIDTTEPRGYGLLHWSSNIDDIAKMKEDALKLRTKIHSYQTKQRDLGIPQSAPAASSPVAATPFKEGALIRNKKDGKLYRVKNGEPVPEEGQNADQSE